MDRMSPQQHSAQGRYEPILYEEIVVEPKLLEEIVEKSSEMSLDTRSYR